MPEIFKPTYHHTIPVSAVRFTKRVKIGGRIVAQDWVRFRQRGGDLVEGEVLACKKKCRLHATKYYGRLRYRDGRSRRVPLAEDKEAARQLRAKLQREIELGEAGIDIRVRRDKRPLIGSATQLPKPGQRGGRRTVGYRQQLEAAIAGSHLADFIASLRAMRRTDKHVWELASQIRNTCVTLRFLVTSDLDEASLNRYLAQLLDGGKSFRSRNYLLTALKSFAKFLVDSDELRQNPFARIKKLNEEADPKRRRRRPLTPEEFERLIAAAEKGPRVEGMSGIDRAMLYILAAWTGYRRSEISRLTLADFRLDDETPVVALPSHHSKARRDDEPIPLHPEVVRRFKAWLLGRSNPDGALFPVANRKTCEMMRRDLQAAGIAYRDSAGQIADFHAHRIAFISNLARATNDFGLVFKLARHSDPKLTAKIYDRVRPQERAAAIAKMPAPPKMGRSRSEL